MLNVYEVLELEKRWQKYNDKRNSKKTIFSPFSNDKQALKNKKIKVSFDKNINIILIIGILVILILAFVYYFAFVRNNTADSDAMAVSSSVKSKFKNPQKQVEKNIASELEQAKIQLEKEKIRLKNVSDSSADIIVDVDKEIESSNAYQQNFVDNNKFEITPNNLLTPKLISLSDDISSYSVDNKQSKKIASGIKPAADIAIDLKAKAQSVNEEVKAVNDSNFVVTFSDTKISVEDLILAFEKKPTALNAIKVSKRYFNDKDYIKSKAWALKANALDKDNEESWILFAKSSYKLGKKQDGIKALNDYLKFNNSDNVKNILKLLEQGNI